MAARPPSRPSWPTQSCRSDRVQTALAAVNRRIKQNKRMGTPPSETPLDQRVLREQIASFYQIYNTIFRSRMAFVLVIGAIMYAEIPTRAVIVYTVAHFLLSLTILLIPRWTSQTPVCESPRWLRTITVCVLLAGVADGIAPWLFVQPGHVPLTAVLMVVLMANCARAAQSLRPFKVALVGHVVAVMLSLIAALIHEGGTYYYFLAAFATVHLAMLVRAGMQENNELTAALTLRFENEQLATRLHEQVLETERISREKTRFLTTASHDLRQPLHAISLFGAALESQLRGTREGINAQRLMKAVNALSHSLETMLDISRIDAGVVKPALQSVPIDPLLISLNHVFGPLAEQKSLQLRMRASGLHVRTDPQLLSRMLANLIDNALKYTTEGGVVVAARVRGKRVWIDVRDTGTGIAQAQHERIFDEFYQIGNPGRDRSLGLGIGLSIVKRLSKILDHPVEMRSRPGRGTSFRISLPHDPAPLAGRADAHADAQDALSAEAMPERVLLLDDEADIREAMAELLGTWGIQLTAVGNEAEAVHAMEEARTSGKPFDLLVCDYRLSEATDGAAVGLRLRADFDADLPFLLISGETAPDRLRRVHELGIPLIAKPVEASALRHVISVVSRARPLR
ncbi:ATP-binding response regulator [Variovorax ginsengisoli]|uniref:histidine kinase n=1 Tax=Variovorax ginsengisoli TaxID=363844 RepID=A0ABT9S8Y5_9BURK|nr:hybrid sensor histidine kinase/response regulator [Variovorax ginsengisoli]MDP9900818.1 signal transduction histidine kinase/CheY-like chemotaxis protein [Variovorax ginsengisoli]